MGGPKAEMEMARTVRILALGAALLGLCACGTLVGAGAGGAGGAVVGGPVGAAVGAAGGAVIGSFF